MAVTEHVSLRVPALALLVLVVLAPVCAPAPCSADATLWIKTSSPWSVTGTDDLARLKYLTSGVSYDFEPTADTTTALQRIGTQTLRCINLEPSEGTFDKAGKFTLEKANPRLD
jgi:hypothetical protein